MSEHLPPTLPQANSLTPSPALTSPTLWQRILAASLRDPLDLWERLDLPPHLLPEAQRAAKQYPLLVPEPYLQRIRRADLHDPLLMQVLPGVAEAAQVPGYAADPLQEAQHMPVPGLLHKYAGRALILSHSQCALHCRYCFRRHGAVSAAPLGEAAWKKILDYLLAEPSIQEVILSGGDPLILSDKVLAGLAADLAGLRQLRVLRIHSRLPLVIPQRVDAALLHWMRESALRIVVVLHVNHPQEIDQAVIAACEHLRQAGVLLLNQTVLLKGINDQVAIQGALAQRLLDAGVLPYYLHQLDAVAGAAHFAVADTQAKQIMEGLHKSLPGYLLPRLVREIPGESSKRWLWPG